MNYTDLFNYTFFYDDFYGVEKQYLDIKAGKRREYSLYYYDTDLDLVDAFEKAFYNSNLPLSRFEEFSNAFTKSILKKIASNPNIDTEYKLSNAHHDYTGYYRLVMKHLPNAVPVCKVNGLEYLQCSDCAEILTFNMPIEFKQELISMYENNPESLEKFTVFETDAPF